MGLQCVLFGHSYGDIEVEERREQDGNEVITTVRETRTCRRCGEELVVSENKEVTTVETAGDDIDGEGGTPEQPDSGTTTSGPAESTGRTADAETDDAEILSNDATTADGATDTTAPTAENTGAASADETSPAADTTGSDGDESSGLVSSAERALGEDPESDPKNKDPETDDAVILGEEEEERQPGEWPDEPEPEDDTDWEPPTDLTSDEQDEPDEQDEEDEKFEDEPEIEQTKAVSTVPEGEFRCPECGFSVDAEESSLRAGDFCPECHRGALEHHTD
jgi:hypothetical protein